MRKFLLVAATAAATLVAASAQAAPVSVKVCLVDVGTVTYGLDREYTYYEERSGRTWTGKWRGSPKAGSSVRVRFPNGRTRTDKFTMVGGQLYLTNRQGERYRASYCD